MHPILFRLGPLRLSMYGLLYAIGFMVAFTYVNRQAKKAGENPNLILDLCFYILLASVIGARIFYIGINYEDYLSNPLAMFKVWQGGLVFYGGFIAAFATSYWFMRKHGLLFLKTADLLIPALPLGHAIGRWGCFFAGCCYGKPATDLPWAITFHSVESLAPKNIPLHPSQIYASLLAVGLFVVLYVLYRRKKFDGQVVISYLILYPITRVIEEFYRGDIARKFLPLPGAPQLISTGEAVSVFIFIAGIALYVFVRRKQAARA